MPVPVTWHIQWFSLAFSIRPPPCKPSASFYRFLRVSPLLSPTLSPPGGDQGSRSPPECVSKVFRLRLFFQGHFSVLGWLPPSSCHTVCEMTRGPHPCSSFSTSTFCVPRPQAGKGSEHRLPASPALRHFSEKYSSPLQTPAPLEEGLLFECTGGSR